MKHLWEVDHPSWGADNDERHLNQCDSFAHLRATVDALDEELNHFYRWDWHDWSDPVHDHLFLDGDDRSGEEFTVYLLLPRKNMCIAFQCPISHEQEPEVLEWLRGPRGLGALRAVWEPILGEAS